MVNGVDQRSAVDLVFQAVDAGAGRKPDTEMEMTEADEASVLQGHLPQGLANVPRSPGKRARDQHIPPLLPPECQGAACHARAALAAFAAACAADRKCREIITGKLEGKETQVGQVAHKATG